MESSFFGITDYVTYLIGVIAVIILPGPNSMYCLYVASSQGIKRGYQTVCAILLGDFVLMTAAILGAAALLKTNATIFLLFKVIGGLYLAYLGLSLIKSTVVGFRMSAQTANSVEAIEQNKQKEQHKQQTNQDDSAFGKSNVFAKALMLSLSNPKAIMFFLSFFLQFIDPNYANPTLSFIILGVTLQVVSFLYLSILIFSGQGLVHFFKAKPMIGIIANSAVGCLFIGFAISLWFTIVSPT